jgi:hypothetical protein
MEIIKKYKNNCEYYLSMTQIHALEMVLIGRTLLTNFGLHI